MRCRPSSPVTVWVSMLCALSFSACATKPPVAVECPRFQPSMEALKSAGFDWAGSQRRLTESVARLKKAAEEQKPEPSVP